jgi:hypothetical protein
MTQDSKRKKKLVIAGIVLAGIPGAVISIFLLLIGLAICVVCIVTFPIGLLGFPFAIGFFIIPLMWFGVIGKAINRKDPREIATKILGGDTSIPEDAIVKAVNSLLDSKKAEDQKLGLSLRDELQKRRQNTSKNS